MKTVIVFGATGSLGSNIVRTFEARGLSVIQASRTSREIGHVNTSQQSWAGKLVSQGVRISGVVWAQGKNISGSAHECDTEQFAEIIDANVGYIHRTFRDLLLAGALSSQCRLVVVSSVWANLGRASKFAYMVSKSALQGLVRSISIDYGSRGIICNAVSPGIIDSDMTRAFLSASQIRTIADETPGGKLVTADQVSQVVAWLVSEASEGVNAQLIAVDNGWSDFREI